MEGIVFMSPQRTIGVSFTELLLPLSIVSPATAVIVLLLAPRFVINFLMASMAARV